MSDYLDFLRKARMQKILGDNPDFNLSRPVVVTPEDPKMWDPVHLDNLLRGANFYGQANFRFGGGLPPSIDAKSTVNDYLNAIKVINENLNSLSIR